VFSSDFQFLKYKDMYLYASCIHMTWRGIKELSLFAFNATVNNISVIWSVFIDVLNWSTGENHRPDANQRSTL
jgi:hypothetical protein